MRLAVIDTQWPGFLGELAPRLEAFGYHRYWATEHHHPTQSGSPTLVAALAAGLTETMRVGTAGVLLQFVSPLRVAEDFRLLELYYPGRVDLGVAAADPGGALQRALLDGRPASSAEGYARRVEELTRLVRRRPAIDGGIDGAQVGPAGESIPPIWICGTSVSSATLAGRLGLSYAFHDYLAQMRPGAVGPDAIAAYRRSFRAAVSEGEPADVVACYGVCAESDAEARAQWAARFEGHGADEGEPTLTPGFLGSPSTCREQLDALARRYDAAELVVQSLGRDFESTLTSYRLLAEALDLRR